MLDDKKIKEVENRIKNYIADGIIKTKEKVEFVEFFLKHSKNFLNSAKAEYLLSTNEEEAQLMTDYWNEIYMNIQEWQDLVEGEINPYDTRKGYVHV